MKGLALSLISALLIVSAKYGLSYCAYTMYRVDYALVLLPPPAAWLPGDAVRRRRSAVPQWPPSTSRLYRPRSSSIFSPTLLCLRGYG